LLLQIDLRLLLAMPEIGDAVGGGREVGVQLAQSGGGGDAGIGEAMLILCRSRGTDAGSRLRLLGCIARGFSLLNILRRRGRSTEQQQEDQRKMPRGLLHAAGRNST